MFVRSFPVKSRKRVARDVVDTLLPHSPALFVTSLTYTVGHKMAALTAVLLQLANVTV